MSAPLTFSHEAAFVPFQLSSAAWPGLISVRSELKARIEGTSGEPQTGPSPPEFETRIFPTPLASIWLEFWSRP